MLAGLVRDAEFLIATGEKGGRPHRYLLVPPALKDYYTQSRRATIEALLAIATFGTDFESLKAIAYAEALEVNPETASHLEYYVHRLDEFTQADSEGPSVRNFYIRNIEKGLSRD